MTIFCSECGTQSKTGTKFCISCGNKLSEVNKQEEVRDKDKKSELSIVENVDYDEVLKDKKKPTIVTSIDVEPTIATKTESKPVVTEPVRSSVPEQRINSSPPSSDTTPRLADGSPDYGEIGRRAAEEAIANMDTDAIVAKAYKTSAKSQRRNAIISLIIGIIVFGGGMVALETDIFIFLLIAGILMIAFAVFMFILSSQNKKYYKEKMEEIQRKQ